jgi:hypothetical protein
VYWLENCLRVYLGYFKMGMNAKTTVLHFIMNLALNLIFLGDSLGESNSVNTRIL